MSVSTTVAPVIRGSSTSNRPRNLPKRRATPEHLLPGFQRPNNRRQRRRSTTEEERRAIRSVTRRRMTPRTAHIMHESTIIDNLVNNDAASFSVADEARLYMEGHIDTKMQWNAPHSATFQFWLPSVGFANLLFNKYDASELKWAVSRAKLHNPTLGSTRVRATFSKQQIIEVFGKDISLKKLVDANNVPYYLELVGEQFKWSYCIESKLLRVRFSFIAFRDKEGQRYYI